MQDLDKKIQILEDIRERLTIAKNYYSSGYLDRDDAIQKIIQLRQERTDILVEAKVEQVKGSIPLEQATNDGLVSELIKQANILELKLAEK